MPGLSNTVAVLPRRLRHAYVVTSTARFLTLHTPAGFEQFAAEVGEPARALTLPPPPAGPPDFAALAQAAARHGITILGRHLAYTYEITDFTPGRAARHAHRPGTVSDGNHLHLAAGR